MNSVRKHGPCTPCAEYPLCAVRCGSQAARMPQSGDFRFALISRRLRVDVPSLGRDGFVGLEDPWRPRRSRHSISATTEFDRNESIAVERWTQLKGEIVE